MLYSLCPRAEYPQSIYIVWHDCSLKERKKENKDSVGRQPWQFVTTFTLILLHHWSILEHFFKHMYEMYSLYTCWLILQVDYLLRRKALKALHTAHLSSMTYCSPNLAELNSMATALGMRQVESVTSEVSRVGPALLLKPKNYFSFRNIFRFFVVQLVCSELLFDRIKIEKLWSVF